jgi:hypothetical protein
LADSWIEQSSYKNDIMTNLARVKNNSTEKIYEDKYVNAMKNAYRLMNEMGEMLRGKPVTYSIVISSGTKNVSKE